LISLDKRPPTDFYNLLFDNPEIDVIRDSKDPVPPVCFSDLKLDEIIDRITSGREEYDLKPFFYFPLQDVEAINYRQQIMQDLENPSLLLTVTTFALRLREMREHRIQADKLRYKYQKERWFLDAVVIYCEAVIFLVHDLSAADLKSVGLIKFREYLTRYTASEVFIALQSNTKKLKADLSAIKFSLLIKNHGFQVGRYESEPDYSAEVESIFQRFRSEAVKDYRVKFSTQRDMNHVEEKVLEFVAQLWPGIFQELEEYCSKHPAYCDGTIATFDRQIQFYIAFLEYIERFKKEGLQFCYPAVSAEEKNIYGYDIFDMALADRLTLEHSPVVCNDIYLKGDERILIVTGPNQGGKTTFARTFGQLHYLALIGCPVASREARLFLFDRIFTHFEREEDVKTQRGALEDGLFRIHDILIQATARSIVIMNESFSSTAFSDALFLSKKVLERIIELDLLAVYVTFLDELSYFSEQTVSMVSTVAPENPATRTFKIARRAADGLAWALSIAEKYRLTYEVLKDRIKP
jgi:DNA mismatch repair protein MutS